MPSQSVHWASFLCESLTQLPQASYNELHEVLFSLINLFMDLLKLKNQSGEASPVDVQSGIMLAFLMAVLTYRITLLAEFRLRTQNSDYYAIVGNFNLSSLMLAMVLILKTIVPFSLWVGIFAIWSCCFVKAAYGSLEDLGRLVGDAAVQVRNLLDKFWGRAKGAEEQNGPAV